MQYRYHIYIIIFILVCIEIHVFTQHNGDLIEWKLGHCSGTHKYQQYMTYVERCCLRQGIYTLTCHNIAKGEGWKGGFIQFQGKRYCDDFLSYKASRKVEITGIHSK